MWVSATSEVLVSFAPDDQAEPKLPCTDQIDLRESHLSVQSAHWRNNTILGPDPHGQSPQCTHICVCVCVSVPPFTPGGVSSTARAPMQT